MAVQVRHLRPIWRAKARREILPRYFRLSGKAFFLLVVLAASLLALAQTGRVVGTAWQLQELQKEEEKLLWEREELLHQIALAANPAELERWALAHGLEPMKPEDLVFIPAAASLDGEATSPVAVKP